MSNNEMTINVKKKTIYRVEMLNSPRAFTKGGNIVFESASHTGLLSMIKKHDPDLVEKVRKLLQELEGK